MKEVGSNDAHEETRSIHPVLVAKRMHYAWTASAK
jgi:hypothetical protein